MRKLIASSLQQIQVMLQLGQSLITLPQQLDQMRDQPLQEGGIVRQLGGTMQPWGVRAHVARQTR